MSIKELGRRAKDASRILARSGSKQRRRALELMAEGLASSRANLLEANSVDLSNAQTSGVTGALLDRLILTEKRVDAMAEGLRAVADQPDPVGEIIGEWERPNGLVFRKVRVPVGVVAVIYEARPNVTADVTGLCLGSANAVILRGSSHAQASNEAIARILRSCIQDSGLPPDAVQLVKDSSREAAGELMRLAQFVDLLIPRGGPELVRSIREQATVPFIIDGDGNCHVYVDATADPQMATEIIFNAKTSRPGVCNAAETLLVHRARLDWLPSALEALEHAGVEIRGDEKVVEMWPSAKPATDQDWGTEFLDLILAVKVVDSIDEAIDHINTWGTSNAEAIVTGDTQAADRFTREVDSGSLFVNASTRFSDGGEFGFGAEIGISTQKLHARGPMGLRELTTYKYIVWGQGQVRS